MLSRNHDMSKIYHDVAIICYDFIFGFKHIRCLFSLPHHNFRAAPAPAPTKYIKTKHNFKKNVHR
jgi:hypothetical protein